MQEVEKTTVKRQQSLKRQHRRKRHNGGYIVLVSFLALLIVFSLCVTRLFNVSKVDIHNTTNATDREIIAICGFENGDNMTLMDTRKMERRIEEQIFYAKDVSVERVLPSTIVISVEKAEPVVNIRFEDGYLLISDSGRILEFLPDAPKEGLLIVEGFPAKDPAIGDKLRAADTRSETVLHQMMDAVAKVENPEIGIVNMADPGDIIVYIGQNITFRMGSSSEAVYKLKFAGETVVKLNSRKKYRLRMVGNNQISVLPEDDELISAFEPSNQMQPENSDGNLTQDDSPVNLTPDDSAGNLTPDDPAGNLTPDNPAGNLTPDDSAGNLTPGDPADNMQPENAAERPVNNVL